MDELRAAAQAVIEWEQEYRTLNHLGRNPPSPFIRLAIALAQPVPAEGAQADQVAWLLERGGLCVGFCEYRFRWVTFTDENALRFARERDAYSFKEAVKYDKDWKDIFEAKVTEHMWVGTAIPPATAAPAERWMCAQCCNLNYASDALCKNCSYPKPVAPGTK